MSSPMRLGPQPGEVIDRSAPVSFRWNDRAAAGHAGDTIISALAAAGERVFSRSFKYHRPRGLLTADYLDPGCTVQVGDEPNVRGAHRLVADGMDVRAQNAWPSLRVDVKAANQLVQAFLPPGFYYKTFIRPQRLWPAYERVLRRFSAGGVVGNAVAGERYDKRHAHPDVLVAGGGPAGMQAALAAARAGSRVLLVEQEHHLGGHLRWGTDAERAVLAELEAAVAAEDAIEVLTDSVVIGRYDANLVAVVQRGLPDVFERLIKARAGVLVVAAGLIERPYVIAGNDLPGVMLSTAVRRLIAMYAVKPGERAVVLTANESGDAAVADLGLAGVEVVHVADARRGDDVVRVRGRGGVQSVELAGGERISCDLFVTATGWTAPLSLLTMAGSHPVYQPKAARYVPDVASLPDDVLAAGGVAGDGSLAELLAHAGTVGAEAARRALGRGPSAPPPGLRVDAHPALFRGRTHGFVDLCEDVTSKDLHVAVGEGYDGAELAKRYTTATMGPTQGKLELVNTIAILAEATGGSIESTGTTTWRPPYAPVTLGALAGRNLQAVRRSPMQGWHERHGASPLPAGAWIRPDHYGDPAAEARRVREAVGVIDVTPIGKLNLRGPDVPKLLNLLYVNKWSRLGVGQVRYGVMCAEDGVVMDDGVTGRLAEDRYLMSTTSSGAESVAEWAENWLQTAHPGWRVHLTPVTTAYASMNVAGPRSRDLLSRLVDGVDLDPDAFGYMRVRTGRVAGVDDCVIWRIGFTGELSFEVHVPASYGLHVWEALLAAGQDLGVGPFGIEAQRILRLEKGHLIVGQDTDGLTKGFSAGLDWAIKLDKDDFAGKPELAWQAASGAYPRLVALQPHDGSVIPPEGCQIVADAGRIVGRITSSRMSPALGRSICLAQLDGHLAAPHTTVSVLMPDGSRIPARVMEELASVDPAGERLRA
ncbi:MAG TPA: 2Fe-2S iron-sulfur cluster-binding protein [Streptosporangiaceae bacterium]